MELELLYLFHTKCVAPPVDLNSENKTQARNRLTNQTRVQVEDDSSSTQLVYTSKLI